MQLPPKSARPLLGSATNSMARGPARWAGGSPFRNISDSVLSIRCLKGANSSVLRCPRARPTALTQLASLQRATPTLSWKLPEQMTREGETRAPHPRPGCEDRGCVMWRQQPEARGSVRCHQQENQGSQRRGTDAAGPRRTEPLIRGAGPRAGAPDGRSCP